MNKKTLITLSIISLISLVQARPQFNMNSDILIAQFDSKPDPDDIHAIAALGCVLAHKDYREVNYLAVAGAYGIQKGRYINAPKLFNLAFGVENVNWVDAHNNKQNSISLIKSRVKTVIDNGGKAWVQEAGQSDITAMWIKALIDSGVGESIVKENVIVVQHSDWNEKHTAKEAFDYVNKYATYQALADGNGHYNKHRGPDTPAYRVKNTEFLPQALNSSNKKAQALWAEANRVIQKHGHKPSHSSISVGGVDFSDCVENWWIFELKDAYSVADFWAKFVTNNQ